MYKTLPEFGPKLVPMALPYWQKEGFVVFTDKEKVGIEIPEKIEGRYTKFLNTGKWCLVPSGSQSNNT